MMNRRTFVVIAGGALFPQSFAVRAQGQRTARQIGFLSAFPRADVEVIVNQLRPELDKLGWTDGRNIVLLEARTAEGRNERLPKMAAELVAQSPDLILVQSTPATQALMQASKTIPIVMVAVGNPVENGLVVDLQNPGGNVTGTTYLADESARKLLQLLKEAAPRVRSVAVFTNPTNVASAPFLKVLRADIAAIGMRAQVVEVSGPGDFEPAFAAIRRASTESILLASEALIRSKRDAIGDFAQRQGLPLAVVGSGRFLPAGGLMAYGPSTLQYAQLTARYIDRILRGAKPANLSVEQPARFELVLNLKTAKMLDLTIPRSLLLRADEVIQ